MPSVEMHRERGTSTGAALVCFQVVSKDSMKIEMRYDMLHHTDRKRIFWLDVARTAALWSICLCHAVDQVWQVFGDKQHQDFLETTLRSSVLEAFLCAFGRIGVPLFLMITGALLLRREFRTTEDIFGFYKKNLLPLVITTEIWYVIIFWQIVFSSRSNYWLLNYSVPSLFRMMGKTMLLTDVLSHGHMWYMPMIFCTYLVLPFVAILLTKVELKALVPLGTAIVIVSFLVPNAGTILSLHGDVQTPFTFEMQPAWLVSWYVLYTVIGYWISGGGLQKVRNLYVWIVFVLSVCATAGMQFYSFTKDLQNVSPYVLNYNFIGILTMGAAGFELLRRGAGRLRRFAPQFAYMSRTAFAIYLLHRVILDVMVKKLLYPVYHTWSRPLTCAAFVVIPIAASLLVIAPLSKIPFFKRYVFLIK